MPEDGLLRPPALSRLFTCCRPPPFFVFQAVPGGSAGTGSGFYLNNVLGDQIVTRFRKIFYVPGRTSTNFSLYSERRAGAAVPRPSLIILYSASNIALYAASSPLIFPSLVVISLSNWKSLFNSCSVVPFSIRDKYPSTNFSMSFAASMTC